MIRTTSRGHHHTHTVMTHDWSFLQGDKRHNHTLKAGHHQFPFSLMLDGNLPSTINTYNGEANISYKLRANVVRSGFSSNFHTSQDVHERSTRIQPNTRDRKHMAWKSHVLAYITFQGVRSRRRNSSHAQIHAPRQGSTGHDCSIGFEGIYTRTYQTFSALGPTSRSEYQARTSKWKGICSTGEHC
jgi:hypothetical protein